MNFTYSYSIYLLCFLQRTTTSCFSHNLPRKFPRGSLKPVFCHSPHSLIRIRNRLTVFLCFPPLYSQITHHTTNTQQKELHKRSFTLYSIILVSVQLSFGREMSQFSKNSRTEIKLIKTHTYKFLNISINFI